MLDLHRLKTALLGDFAWTPPAYLRRAGAFTRAHRWVIAASLLAFVALIFGGLRLHEWWENRPQPEKVAVTVDAIPVTPLEEKLVPRALVVRFDASVAPLHEIGKRATGVSMSPAIAGSWEWATDNRLVFAPRQDWPAATTYTITLDPAAFPKHVLLDRQELEVTTPPFEVTITDFDFYQNPKDPNVRQAVAKLRFTHPVAQGELESRALVSLLGASPIFPEGKERLTVKYGLHDREAWIRSAELALPEREDFMKVTLPAGLRTTLGGAQTTEPHEEKVRIPDRYSFFQIDGASGTIVQKDDGNPEQVLIIRTSAQARSEEVAAGLELCVLPERKEGEEPWEGPAQITAEMLAECPKLPLGVVSSEHDQSRVHTFGFAYPGERQLFVRVKRGTRALGDFALGADYSAVIAAPQPDREVQIEGEGGLLALLGERQLSIKSRGLPAIEYEVARVATAQINHLVSQTYGDFQNPEFRNYAFDEENISRIATERQPIAMTNRLQPSYSAFNLARHLALPADGGSERGLFFITAHGFDPVKDKRFDKASDRRFILVTDLGLLVKTNADKSSDVFIASIKNGGPVTGATVEVLGKNGVPLASGVTGEDGRVTVPALDANERERTPVAFVARLGEDVSFMSFDRADRRVNLSRFDTGGIENVSPETLDAFLFTERGIYRPGDLVHLGLIVKERNWAGQLTGLPLEVEFVDARGASAQLRRIALSDGGFDEQTFQTAYESPSGSYTASIYLVRGGKRDLLLGSASFLVKEFLPDRMKIAATLSKSARRGWVTPGEMCALVNLKNLYGTPATDRRIRARIELSPTGFYFAEYEGFTFYDRLRDDEKERNSESIDLGEQKTDDQGETTFDLGLERFADATYAMSFIAEGFEGEGGRSVFGDAGTLVSPLPFVVGCRAEGDLGYIEMGSERGLEFIAVNPQLEKVSAESLTFSLTERMHVSILTEDRSGNFSYKSVLRERPAGTSEGMIGIDGFSYRLPTEKPGNYVLEVRDGAGVRLSEVSFSVVGRGGSSRALDRNAELEIKLDRASYNSGDEIEVAITAPYTGAGLITIESDRVYNHVWFHADTTSTVARIKVPSGLEGTGYVHVSFVRGLDSKEIFMSPLSSGVAPFVANRDRRTLQVALSADAVAKPGEPLRIGFKTDRPARIAVFAVDQGILQVTRFQTPDPLAYFFRKTALEVGTQQIVDLLLPEYSLLRASAFGGDSDTKLNPFKRVTEKPVVFWSGIVEAGPEERTVVYDVPDYFAGTLTLMAVAAGPDGAGSATRDAIIRGPFVITPSVPTLAAPGDEFEVGVTVANNVEGSGEEAEISLGAELSGGLELLDAPAMPLRIGEGREISVVFKFRARDSLGSASIAFRAAAGGKESRITSTLSIRPASPFMTSVRSGSFKKGTVEVPVGRAMYAEFRELEATLSALPLGLAHGLDAYLRKFPYGCSEQITSAAFCRLMLADEADFGITRAEANEQMESVFSQLRRRQNDQGAFGYWSAGGGSGVDFVSVYVMHFLSEARAAGFAPPGDLFDRGLRHLRDIVVAEPRSIDDARTIAYAIYLLTREGVITTNYILNLRDWLEKRESGKWENDLTGVYLSGALAILKKDAEAEKMIGAYTMGQWQGTRWSDFYQPLGSDSQYVAMLARHFPERLRKLSPGEFEAVLKPIGEGSFNTLSAAYAVVALKAYSHAVAGNPPEFTMSSGGQALASTGTLVKRATFSSEAAALRFEMRGEQPVLGAFHQIVEAGYDRAPAATAVAEGIEVYRELLQDGEPVTEVKLGEPLTVRLKVRSLTGKTIPNAAIIDLLPGGFEIVGDSLPGGFDHVEPREDRVVFFGSIQPRVRTISYKIKPVNRGVFTVPAPFAESMYDRALKARGVAGTIRVTP